MGIWSYYFLAKLGLHVAGMIPLDWIWNLLFAVVLALPVKSPAFTRARSWLAIPVGLCLFWHDTYWPDFRRVIVELPTLIQFTADYWFDLVGRVISWRVLGGLIIGGVVWYLTNARFRLGTVAILGLVCLPLVHHLPVSGQAADVLASDPPAAGRVLESPSAPVSAQAATNVPVKPLTPSDLTHLLQTFYSEQQSVSINVQARKVPAFDLVFLSVCSLGWDDLRLIGLENSPLLQRFDLMFRNFNTAASYSGPAVLRLLQSSCGQPPQNALYQTAPGDCYLFDHLQRLGYHTEMRLNHQGTLGGFAKQVSQYGHAGPVRMPPNAAPTSMQGVDGTPIRSDLEVLKAWQNEAAQRSQPSAVIYNTVSLHDGNRLPGVGPQVSKDTYRQVTQKLFQDLQEFMHLVELSGRPTVIVLVPEHGAGLRGDSRQISGLREFPTPRVTHVPAGVALLGFGIERPKTGPILVEGETSYTALIGAISVLLNSEPQRALGQLRQYATKIPTMKWVAENDSTVVVENHGDVYMRTGSSGWHSYPKD